MARFWCCPALVALALFASSLLAIAQNDPIAEQGIKPYGAYHGGDIDVVSLVNGKLDLHVPIYSLPQRGGKMSLGFTLRYNNPTVTYNQVIVNGVLKGYYWEWSGLGVQVLPDLPEGVLSTIGAGGKYVYSIAMADGSSHQLGYLSGSTTFEAIDASGFHYDQTSNVVTDRAGIRYSENGGFGYPSKIEDPNGNEITTGPGATWVDTLGRSVPQPPPSNGSTSTSVCPSGPLPVSSAYLWSVPGPSGATVNYTFCYALVPVTYGTTMNNIHAWSGNVSMLQTLVLPNNTSWTFQYNSTGDLATIALPTSGTISYSWFQGTLCGGLLSYPYRYFRGISNRTVNDGNSGHNWTYSGITDGGTSGNPETVTVADPIGNQSVHTITAVHGCSYYETLDQEYQLINNTQTLLKTTKTDYYWMTDPAFASGGAINVVPIRVTTTWPNNQVTKVEKDYDTTAFTFYTGGQPYSGTYGNVVAERDYDYGTGSPGPELRQKAITYAWSSNSSYLGDTNLVSLPYTEYVYDSTGTILESGTYYYYDSNSLQSSGVTTQKDSSPPDGAWRGNLTITGRWLNTANTYLGTSRVYFDTGMVNTVTDPLGNKTTDTYSSNFYGAYLTQQCNALSQCTTFNYDFNTGLPVSTTDPNNQTTSKTYDNMWRETQITYPTNGGQTTFCYTDTGGGTCSQSAPPYKVVITGQITSSLNKVTTEVLDGLGRLTQTQLNSDPETTDYVDITYDPNGRKATESNPHRSSSLSTDGTTTYSYDALSRITAVAQPDGSQLQTSFTGNCTTVTDEAGKIRKSCVDGLGRLTGVWEDPNGLNYETDYAYDPLGNLLSVNQKGGSTNSANWRTRTFTYDTLSRILCAANPEIQSVTCPSSAGSYPVGAIVYTYDHDGNLLTRTAPAPNQTGTGTGTETTTYSYDALNRITKETYSDGSTPTVQYGYDGVSLTGCTKAPPSLADSYPIGRRTSMCDGSGGTSWSHDQMGRVLQEERIIGSANAMSVNYAYNLDGSIASLTTPPLKTIAYTPGGAGRPLKAVDATDSINFVTGATYSPSGALTGMVNGSTSTFAGITTTNGYNDRLQPVLVSSSSPSATVFSLCHDFHLGSAVSIAPCSFSASTLGDNGNLYQIVNNKDNTRTRNYSYDSLNRVNTASTQGTSGPYCWGQNFTIDAWSNINQVITSQCSAPPWSNSAGPNNEVIGFCYDTAGNLLDQATCPSGNHTYVYDGENRLVWTAGYRYIYDGDGERVEKCAAATSTTPCPTSGTNGTLYWKGVSSDTLDETDLSGNVLEEYTYFAGQRVARRDISTNVVHYYFSDHLGSASVITDSSGNIQQESDYYPYGGELVITGGDPNHHKFTGKERDTESGLDNFGARYYSSTMGRFMTPDWAARPVTVPYAKFGDPQTLNLYSYVENGPLNRIDADGHRDTTMGTGTQTAVEVESGGCSGANSNGEPCTSGQASTQTAQNANTIPFPAPIVFPALDKVVDVVVGGLERAGEAALSSAGAAVTVALGYLVSPGTSNVCTCSTDQPQVPTTKTSGPKAADAPGVTAGGQATDAYGNKLGPSGRPQVNETNSNTREAARNRALGQGSGAVEHSNPKVGKPHFHPTDAKGNKIPGSTHNNYPED